MRRNLFEIAMSKGLSLIALTVILVSGAWAQPKFKILATVPGGLFGGVTFDATGNLYGTTTGGGDHNDGTIFELMPGARGWVLTTLHSFDGYDGGSPNGGLVFDAAGNMYGATPSGGSTNGGVIFEMTAGSDGWSYNILYTFCQQYHCPDGGYPSGLVLDGARNLYGVAAAGAFDEGVVYELARGAADAGSAESVLYNFEGVKTGFGPSGPLIFNKTGELYGTTVSGGRTSSSCYFGCGTIFELSHYSGGWRRRTLWQFSWDNGVGPRYGVVLDNSGNLYGTTVGGGARCDGETCGTAFKLTRLNGHWKENIIYSFANPAEGFYPSSGVVFDKAGNLYGTTVDGGIGACYHGCGVVYKLSPGADGKWKYTVLHEFSGTGGGLPPAGNLVFDKEGNLYGAAYNVVYEIIP